MYVEGEREEQRWLVHTFYLPKVQVTEERTDIFKDNNDPKCG